MSPANRLADDVGTLGSEARLVDVQVSYDVVKLFSEQLYASPVKAIEELVVNSWDADARECSVVVDLDEESPLIAVLDNGSGLTLDALEDLWHIGVSKKLQLVTKRKQIGKFGIGKLASYAVARHATYISKTAEGIYAVTINFESFAEVTDAAGNAKPVTLRIRKLSSVEDLESSVAFVSAMSALKTSSNAIDLKVNDHWTVVILEDLKDKSTQLATGRLQWVLETAMPFAADFVLYLNGTQVKSSKDQYNKIVRFKVVELEDERLKDLSVDTGETWTRTEEALVSESFPSGVTGEIYVTDRSLYAEGGKSEDLGRSHGFFVRVHNRLINETDPLFGARPLSFTTWYSFAAVVDVDDLNQYVTASRDDVEQSSVKAKLRLLLIQLFNQARDQQETVNAKKEEANRRGKEGVRDYVSTGLIERPLADALVARSGEMEGDDDGFAGTTKWRMIEPVTDVAQLQELVEQLYSAERKDRQYTFKYSPAGAVAPLVRLDATKSTFYVNEDHQLVREFSDKPDAKRLLEAMVVGETLLEVYLRAADVPPETILDLLDRRDSLLRSLALDRSYSLPALAAALRDSESEAHDLEIALVGAVRALGFSAEHVGGSGTPDGIAKYVIHGIEGKTFTLEAKSSGDVPSLSQLDFAGLRSHYESTEEASGCLLVAPSYPGGSDTNSEVSKRARQQSVSCWTVDQLAKVVEAAERRHINAQRFQRIVLENFDPASVTAEVDRLLQEPSFDQVDLYNGILEALAALEPRLRKTARNVSMIAAEISRNDGFQSVDAPDVQEALQDLSRASRGMLYVANDQSVTVLGSLDELRRRVAGLTSAETPPRRNGTFRADEG